MRRLSDLWTRLQNWLFGSRIVPRRNEGHRAWITQDGAAVYLNVAVNGHERKERIPRHLVGDALNEHVAAAAVRMRRKINRGI